LTFEFPITTVCRIAAICYGFATNPATHEMYLAILQWLRQKSWEIMWLASRKKDLFDHRLCDSLWRSSCFHTFL